MHDAQHRYPRAWVLAMATMLATGLGTPAAGGPADGTAAALPVGSPVATNVTEPAVAVSPLRAASRLEPPASRVFTLLDYFQAGERAIDRFLAAPAENSAIHPAGDLDDVLARIRSACVRVDVQFDIVEDRYQSVTGSGVLLDQGRLLLTAGHVIDGLEGDYEISVVLSNGDRRKARMLEFEYDRYGGSDRDWAILAVEGPAVASIPWLSIGTPQAGDTAIVLGYPNEIGMDSVGEMTFAGQIDGYLSPLATIGLIEDSLPLVLQPYVGAVPTSGMSGAPVFDSSGRLIGIFVSIAQRVSRDHVIYRYQAASVRHLQQHLVSLRSALYSSQYNGTTTGIELDLSTGSTP